MKVQYPSFITGLSGKNKETVYMPSGSPFFGYARVWVAGTPREQSEQLKNASRNLAIVWSEVDPLYKADLEAYTDLYKAAGDSVQYLKRRATSPYAVFTKMFWAWQDSDPEHVFLDSFSIADIISMEAPVKTVKDAIEFGFLPVVPGYTDFDNLIKL